MSTAIYRFRFHEQCPFEEVESAFLQAVFVTENLHGEAQVRLEAAHAMDREKRTCVIDATSSVGQDLTRVFVGFLTRNLGPEAFQIERIPDIRREELVNVDA